MEEEKNITGISENLADSNAEQKALEKKISHKTPLEGQRIAISISESEELEYLGLSEHHLKDVSIEIARYLIVNGATMLYGGDLRNGGFTRLFSELSYQYKYISDKSIRFENYFFFPSSSKISLDEKANLKKQQVIAHLLNCPAHIGKLDEKKEFNPVDSIEDRFLISECLTDMRIRMAKESDARILVGGKQKKHIGYLPGIFEEAYQTLKHNKPIYLVGGFGGATKSIISAIKGERNIALTNDFQFDTEFLKAFRNFAVPKASIKVDLDYYYDFFSGHTVESLAKQNGLTPEENKILFESNNIHELVFLILKGLQNITKKQ